MFRRGIMLFALAIVLIASAAPTTKAQLTADCSSICVSFVTSYDPDGTGPVPAITARHDGIPVDVPYVLDTDGILPPLPLGVLPTVPGYELRATVQATDAAQPTIVLEKLLTAPPVLPLRVELVRQTDGAWQSFGYDTLTSSAPKRFEAALDLRNRDGNAATDDAAVNLKIGDPAATLTVVNESFGGDPAGTRTQRKIRRLTFSGDAKGAKVPSTVTLDAVTAAAKQHIVLTRDVPTILTAEISEPGSKTTATLDRLPSRTDLTMSASSTPKTQTRVIDYVATSPITQANLTSVSGGRTTTAAITGLPAKAHVTYNDAKDTYDGDDIVPTDTTRVTYTGSSAIGTADLTTSVSGRSLRVHAEHIPAIVNDLSAKRRNSGAKLHMLANGRMTKAELEMREGVRHQLVTARNVPSEVTVNTDSSPTSAHAHYHALQVADGVHIVNDDDQGQHLDVDVTTIPTDLDLAFAKRALPEDGWDLAYTADGSVGHLVVDGTGLKGLPHAAPHAHLDLTGLPLDLRVGSGQKSDVRTSRHPIPSPPSRLCESDRPPPACEEVQYDTYTTTHKEFELHVWTPRGRLGAGDLLITSGPEDRLAATSLTYDKPQDGLLMRDLPDRYVLSGRMKDFEELMLNRSSTVMTRSRAQQDRQEQSDLHAVFETSHNDGRALTLDMKQGPDSARQETLGQLGAEPGRLVLDLVDDGVFETTTAHLHTGWPIDPVQVGTHTERALQFRESVQRWDEQPQLMKLLTLSMLPINLDVCRKGLAPDCAAHVFDQHINDIAAGRNANYSCFGEPCVNGVSQSIPIDPAIARFGSLSLDASTPTNFAYTSRASGETSVDLEGLHHFALQADQRHRPCFAGYHECTTAYVAMDTANEPLRGTIRTVAPEGSKTEFRFAPGFSAGARVMGVNQAWDYAGEAAIQADDVNCPGDTSIKTSDRDITTLFCDGTVFPFKFLW